MMGMDKRQRAIAIVAAILIAAIAALAYQAASAAFKAPGGAEPPSAAADGAQDSLSTETGKDTSTGAVDEETAADSAAAARAGHLEASQVSGLDNADWLDDDTKGQLVSALEAKVRNQGHLSERHFEVVGEHRQVGDIVELFVKDTETGVAYRCNVGARFGVYELTEHVEGVNDEAFDASAPELANMDQYSDLSTKETVFDMDGAWPLSYEQARDILPDAVADRLLGDINGAIEPLGGHVDGAINVTVGKDVKESKDGSITFRVLVYSGIDQAVIECVYDAASAPVSFTHMP